MNIIDAEHLNRTILTHTSNKSFIEWREFCSKQLEQPYYCQPEESPHRYSLSSLSSSIIQPLDFYPKYMVSGPSGIRIANNSLLPQ